MRVALVCVAKNEDNTILEWVEYNKKLGFDKIFIYQNDWVCKIENPILEKIVINGPHKQMESYKHFINHFNQEYDWVAFFDCDEYLVLKKHNSIKDFINEYNNPYGISVNWYFFGSQGQKNIDENKNSLIKRFKKRNNNVDQHIKTILNLKSGGIMVMPHNPNTLLMDTNRNFFKGPFNVNGPSDVVQLNHYHHKSLEEWESRLVRGQADHSKRSLDEWYNSIENDIDVEDLNAYNFLYK